LLLGKNLNFEAWGWDVSKTKFNWNDSADKTGGNWKFIIWNWNWYKIWSFLFLCSVWKPWWISDCHVNSPDWSSMFSSIYQKILKWKGEFDCDLSFSIVTNISSSLRSLHVQTSTVGVRWGLEKVRRSTPFPHTPPLDLLLTFSALSLNNFIIITLNKFL